MRAIKSTVIIAALATSAAFPPSECSAQEPPSPTDILAAYRRLNSYCDKGVELWQSRSEFSRCIARDGRFKEVSRSEESGRTRIDVVWTNGEILYRYWWFDNVEPVQTLDGYTESPLQWHYSGTRDDIFSLFVLQKFFPEATNKDLLERTLKVFSPVADATDTRFYVLERLEQRPSWGGNDAYTIRHRLLVSRDDGLIRKYETFSHGLGSNYIVDLNYVDTAKSPSEDDLRFVAPLSARFSMGSHRAIFVAGLCLFAFLTGLIIWLVQGFIKGPGAIEVYRRGGWRLYSKIAVITLVCLMAFGILSLGARVILAVYFYGVYYAVGFGMVACFLLSSHLAQPMAEFLRSKRRES